MESTTLSHIDQCLLRLNQGDETAWNELFEHAFDRLLAQCSKIVREKLTRTHPLITANSLLSEVYQRISQAILAEKVQPQTSRDFFGLTARHIRWQIQDMVRKRAASSAEEDILAQITSGHTYGQHNEIWSQFWEAVQELSEEQREVFDLLWIHGLSQNEAAQALNCTRNQVDSLWRKIKLKLARALKDLDPQSGSFDA